MTAELEKAFIQYAERVNILSQRVAILPDKKQHLANYVEEIEKDQDFLTLVQATRNEFGNTRNYRNESTWRSAVRNVLRRSGFYINILEKKLNDPSKEFGKYEQVFKSSEKKISYLAPLEWVSFKQGYSNRQDDIDCGHFQIKRFSKNELDAVLDNSIKEIFYPWAVVDLSQITDYWFIYLQETIQITEIIPPTNHILNINWSDDICIEMKYFPRPLPGPLKSVIKLLALFDWPTSYGWGQAVESATGWNRFNIPFVLTVTDGLYETPSRAPQIEELWTEPLFDHETGEEVGEYPVVLISLDEQETELLIAFVKRIHKNLQKLDFEKSGWHFFEVALNMCIKAFFADGLEQLLWHITTVEALLGEDAPGLNEKLSRRIAAICGKTKKEKDSLRKKFKELYNFRSDLVHGNQFKKDVYWGHLREARDFAQQVLVWFLEFLSIIQDGISQDQSNPKYPKRDLLLKLLDMDATERSQLKTLFRILPSEFPKLFENEDTGVQ